MTTIRYFIPEDGDVEDAPNVFLAPKPRQQGYPPTLGEIKAHFPLPGRYHFRFKCPLVPGSDRDKGAMAVWMDVTDDRKHVPTWKSAIIAKITRVAVEDLEDDDDDDSDFVRAGMSNATPAPAPQAQSRPAPAATPTSTPSLDIFGSGASPASQSAPPSGNVSTGGSLLDGHHAPTPVQAQSTMSSHAHTKSGDSLLDMHTPYSTGHHHATTTPAAPSSNNAHADFFGMTQPSPNPVGMGGGINPSRSAPSPPVSGNYNPHISASMPNMPNMYQQQQQQQQRPPPQQQGGAFNTFSQNNGPFGDLAWK